ncbi:hypothetical protein PV11_03514 [Exophiala sideris]|uniref:Uncharacterized protein n=1 Tax=Exophiala sideris TaxID=1016849 RepID=A0A0D1YEE3_9EURO|nr:hypothetical protein PV11_03514 [Exophiala sideris]
MAHSTPTVQVQERASNKQSLVWKSDNIPLLSLHTPIVLELGGNAGKSSSANGQATKIDYSSVDASFPSYTGVGTFDTGALVGGVTDKWTQLDDSSFLVRRSVHISKATGSEGIRIGMELQPAFPEGVGYNDLEYYAPNACYNLNDLNEDGLDDYLEQKRLSYREDRLNALSVLVFHPKRKLAISISRTDIPKADTVPVRQVGQAGFLQETDIGSLGFEPIVDSPHNVLLTASYPYVERDACNALLVQERSPWGAFRSVSAGEQFSLSYTIRIYQASSAHEALWELIRKQFHDLKPKPVRLDRSLQEISKSRLQALSHYFMEDNSGGAGFVTNCHPQDGKQLANVVQYGFTGQQILNAANLLKASARESKDYLKAMKVINFYVKSAAKSPYGFTHGLYNMDLQRHDSWWTGLLLPLAYAEAGEDLEKHMGPLYSHREPIITALSGTHGIYLRCVLEETEALLHLYDRSTSSQHEWFDVAKSFGQFLLATQENDGAWRRAYSLEGQPLVSPDFWFGQTYYQQRSSTATVIPLLLRLSNISGDPAYRNAAVKAGRFVREELVDKVKHNGGIHDSIYAKPQLVDHESIYFCCRALLALYDDVAVGSQHFLEGAIRAAQLSASWIMLWDVPLPANSTLGNLGFRSTGCAGCDTPGAGYVHPMGVIAVPDLIRIAQLTCDTLYLDIAELCFMGNNQNVGKKWGYAMEGLQEEGVLLSPWFVDDPMFAKETGFGGRGKGEGNKTCLPWISAVTVSSVSEMQERFGTLDFGVLRQAIQGRGVADNVTKGENDGVKVKVLVSEVALPESNGIS